MVSSQTQILVSKQSLSGQLYFPLIKKIGRKMRLLFMVAPCVRAESSISLLFFFVARCEFYSK